MRPDGAESRQYPSWRSLLRWWPTGLCLIGVGLAIALALRFQWTLDDAYIAFSYAQNWVQGNGVVFNAGERVEGYTCFLWVALSALGLFLGADIVWWSTTLGVLSTAGIVLATALLARELAPARLHGGAALSALMVGAYPPLGWWAASGMETALFTFLVTLALWLHIRSRAASIAAPICLALASMTRPEGLLLSVLLCSDAVLSGSRRAGVRYCVVFLTIFAPYYAWRYWYYGYPLPNTFYAKVASTPDQLRRGVAYLRLFISTGGGVWLLAGGVAAVLSGTQRHHAVIYAFLLLYIGYVTIVGGDVFPLYRFFIPAIPALAAASIAGVLHWADRLAPGRTPLAYAACGVFAAVFIVACAPLFALQKRELGVTRVLNNLGQALCPYVKEKTGPEDAVATVGIGQLKYCSGRRVIDLVGLTDVRIAHRHVVQVGKGLPGHEKYDSEYVLAQRPKYILLVPNEKAHPYAVIQPLQDLRRHPLFQRNYIAEGSGLLSYYRRSDAPPLMPSAP